MLQRVLRYPSLLLPGLALVALGSCTHGGASFFGIIGGGASGGTQFTRSDLAGDWTGVMTPDDPALESYPFYIRADSAGTPFAGADGLGTDWDLATAQTSAAVDELGNIGIEIDGTGSVNRIQYSGSFAPGALSHSGTYTIYKHSAIVQSGSYQVTRSSGPGHFTIAQHLAGSWSGIAWRHVMTRKRDLLLDLAPDGSVTGGELVGEHIFTVNGQNAGIFNFSTGIDSVGRLDNVHMVSDDGSTQDFHFLIVTDDGTLMGGPGVDSVLGDGIVRITKSPPAE